MFGIHDIALFIISGFLLNLTPGPDSILIMSRSASNGWRAGSVAAFGVCTGCYVHVFAAALGLSAILASSAMAFTIVKLIGAAYLVYMGLSALFSHSKTKPDKPENKREMQFSHKSIFIQGFLSNALNPKVALFFLAFVPQFIDHDASNKALAFLILGSMFIFNSLIYCNLLAVFTAVASSRLKVNQTIANILNKTIGALFISFGLKLAFMTRN
ncbi:LysE family translocator [Pseudaeromonas sharmana]|uniref:LysE family translocator n=1 Tax=Pseudaeromonas sharmana TaxID=328412 RepID=A0ABV8CJ79_9GAMM